MDRALADLDALSPELAMVVAEFQEEPWLILSLWSRSMDQFQGT